MKRINFHIQLARFRPVWPVTLVILLLASPVWADPAPVAVIAGGGNSVPAEGIKALELYIDSYAHALDEKGNIYITDDQYSKKTAGVGFFRINQQGLVDTVFSDTREAAYLDDMAVGPNGDVYLVYSDKARVYRVDEKGSKSLVAGNGTAGYSGDGGAAKDAPILVSSIAVGRDNKIFLGGGKAIREVDSSGIISTAHFNETSSIDSLYQDDQGNLYFADSGSGQIKRLDSDGKVTVAAGDGDFGHGGDGEEAVNASIGAVYGITGDKKGNIYFSENFRGTTRTFIRKIDIEGIISTLYTINIKGELSRLSSDDAGTLYVSHFSPFGSSSILKITQ
jgi:hypothetical protein